MFRFIVIVSIVSMFACAPKRVLTPELNNPVPTLAEAIQSSWLNDHFMGFVLLDPSDDKRLIDINGDKLFTPASNTKILTYYLSRKVLGDSIPSFDIGVNGDSLFIRGTGDPYLFGRMDSGAFVRSFIEDYPQDLYFDNSNYSGNRWGSGWSWDDHSYAYQKEINALPIFENSVIISKDSLANISIIPAYFDSFVDRDSSISKRYTIEELSNQITINPLLLKEDVDYEIPFHMSDSIYIDLLTSMMGRKIGAVSSSTTNYSTIYHHSIDTLYRALMIDSDNFIAEQLLLGVSHEIDSSLSFKAAIQYGIDKLLPDNALRWVDGSGLSRYNLISPNTLIHTLDLILEDFGIEEIQEYFPSGHADSTLDPIFMNPKGRSRSKHPFVYAKTGTLSNNHNLSGYIYCQSGKVLIFSFMNNHYLKPKSHIVREMYNVLSKVYWAY